MSDQATTSTAEANVYDIATDADHDTAYSTLQTVSGTRETSDKLYHNLPDNAAQKNAYSILIAR